MADTYQLALTIIQNNQYMVLATTGKNNFPWISPVVYVYDSDFIFYFISKRTSLHIQNLRNNKNLSFAIFDSHQDFGEGVGLQIEAVSDQLSLSKALQIIPYFLSRKWLYGKLSNENWFTEVLENETYVIHALKPTKVWMNNPDPQSSAEADTRIEIKL